MAISLELNPRRYETATAPKSKTLEAVFDVSVPFINNKRPISINIDASDSIL